LIFCIFAQGGKTLRVATDGWREGHCNVEMKMPLAWPIFVAAFASRNYCKREETFVAEA